MIKDYKVYVKQPVSVIKMKVLQKKNKTQM